MKLYDKTTKELISENEMNQLDKNITLVCAMRYALGRKTYVVSSVVNQIVENWHNIDQSSKEVILEEINDAINKNEAGMDCDINEWKKVIDYAIKYEAKE